MVGHVGNHSRDGAAAPSSHLVDTGVGGDAVQPCGEGAPPVEPAETPDRGKERVLGGIEGVGLVAEHPPAQRVHAVVVRRDQGLERFTVAPASCFENLPVAAPGRIEVVVDAERLTRVSETARP